MLRLWFFKPRAPRASKQRQRFAAARSHAPLVKRQTDVTLAGMMKQLLSAASLLLVLASAHAAEPADATTIETYPIDDLAVWRLVDDQPIFDPAILIAYLQATCSPKSWDDNHDIRALGEGKRLAVTHTPAVHAEIAAALELLRHPEKPKAPNPHNDEVVIRIVHPIDDLCPWRIEADKPERDPALLVAYLSALPSNGARECQPFVMANGNMSLVVSDTRSGHDAVANAIHELRVAQQHAAE